MRMADPKIHCPTTIIRRLDDFAKLGGQLCCKLYPNPAGQRYGHAGLRPLQLLTVRGPHLATRSSCLSGRNGRSGVGRSIGAAKAARHRGAYGHPRCFALRRSEIRIRKRTRKRQIEWFIPLGAPSRPQAFHKCTSLAFRPFCPSPLQGAKKVR
jgi:hypothetical protein